jgi:ATP-dependent Clp endopeptidase proteolytic subunit ClpP
MIGHIYITGQIGSFEGVKGIELVDLIIQVQRQKAADTFYVYVDSPGGSIDVGDNIYMYLKSLPQIIMTVGFGMVASIATKAMLAGEERIMIQGQSEFMIHNPWAGGVSGDAEDLMSIAEEIRAEEDKLISFYSEATGISKEGLDALMKAETFLAPEKALELGFITKVITKEEALAMGMIFPTAQVAKLKALAFKKTEAKKENTMSKQILSKLDEVLAYIGIKKEEKVEVKALVVSDSNGVSLNITKEDGTDIQGMPVQGDMVTVDGQPADGSYILPDMKITIVVKAGIVDTVTPDAAAAVVDPALEQAQKDLTAALAKVKELEAKDKENESFKSQVETKFALLEKGLKASNSNYVVQGRTTEFREKEKQTSVAVTKAEMRKRRESYKKD